MNISKRRILVVIPFAFHRESGSSLSSYYRVKALAALVKNIDVITTPHGVSINESNVKIFRTPARKLFKTYQPGEYKKRLVYDIFLLIKIIKFLRKKKYSLVIIHGSCIYWAFWLQLLFKPPFYAMIHGNIQYELEKWGISRNLKLKRFATYIENKLISSFDHIIAEHGAVRKILTGSGIDEEKISLIRICVHNIPEIEKKEKNKNNKFIILYTGTFVEIQNLALIYKAASLLRNEEVQFILVGGIEEEILVENLKINKLKVSHKVIVKPRVKQKDLMRYFVESDIVISPRTFGHDTPMKIFDYMNFGKCILATDDPIHKEILNNQNSFLTKGTPQEFAKAILFLKNNSEIVEKLGKCAKKDFEDKYSLETMKIKYQKLLQNV